MPAAAAIPNVLDNYRASASANPTSAEAQSNLGWGYYGQHQYDDAIQAFQAALALDNGFIDAHYGLGLAFKEAGRGPQAVPQFEQVVKLTGQLDGGSRSVMLARLARAHINRIERGNWHIESDPSPIIG